ncbi:hypothetical protein ACFXKG_30575 [Streptomyces sp. NPDC059255]|uniref:hypothetical protein n=1 Tax=Streptomyces sp. NPDC059255 TaxID=3346793 RepID=UPI0036818F54
MPTADSPLGRLVKHLSAAPAPRHYPPTLAGRLIAALAGQPLPKRGTDQESEAAREEHPRPSTRRPPR